MSLLDDARVIRADLKTIDWNDVHDRLTVDQVIPLHQMAIHMPRIVAALESCHCGAVDQE